MNDAGWESIRTIRGTIESADSMDAAQLTQWQEALDQCGEETGWGTAWANLSEAQMRELYEQELAEHDCIVDAGYESDQPPSQQAYLDTFHTGTQYYAIRAAETLPTAEFDGLIRRCPPPTWFLNIEGL